jgi:hypothetical protein
MEGNDGNEPPKRSGPAIAGWPNFSRFGRRYATYHYPTLVYNFDHLDPSSRFLIRGSDLHYSLGPRAMLIEHVFMG